MQVRVLFFGMLRDVLGDSPRTVELPAGATVADLLAGYERQVPRFQQFLPAIAVSVNQEYAGRGAALREGDEVALLPPVSGGAPEPVDPWLQPGAVLPPEPLVRIVHEKIEPHQIVPPLERPEDGAIVIFDGIVRNHSRGRATLYLDYEAYEEMALKQMRALAAQALQRFPVRNLALVHRLGRLRIGESSVFIAVFSAHRGPAFEACRWIIDTLKKTVPIWKKEYFADGAVWADGEPFPDEIPTAGGTAGVPPASK